MVLPAQIFMAARNGDIDLVEVYLDNPDYPGAWPKDINEHTDFGGTILMGAVSQIDSAAKLAFVWELVNRGADLHSVVDPESRAICVFDMACSGVCSGISRPELFRDFVLQWLDREDFVLSVFGPRVSAVCELFARGHSSRPVAEVVFALVRAGSPVYDRDALERYEARHPQFNLAQDEHWLACKTLILGVRAAGSWRAYARLPRKRVLRLRSLMLRGRTKDAADPIVAHVLRLPNELCWHVLEFWRVESEVTGEVI